jgi:hypothetical protein
MARDRDIREALHDLIDRVASWWANLIDSYGTGRFTVVHPDHHWPPRCPKCGGSMATEHLDGCTEVSCLVRPVRP